MEAGEPMTLTLFINNDGREVRREISSKHRTSVPSGKQDLSHRAVWITQLFSERQIAMQRQRASAYLINKQRDGDRNEKQKKFRKSVFTARNDGNRICCLYCNFVCGRNLCMDVFVFGRQ